jgi:hypothetical protein
VCRAVHYGEVLIPVDPPVQLITLMVSRPHCSTGVPLLGTPIPFGSDPAGYDLISKLYSFVIFFLFRRISHLMLYREIIAVCSESHTKHINTLCGQNVELFNVKPGGI